MIMQDSSSTEETDPLHDDSYVAELAKLRERSRARIATATESQCPVLLCYVVTSSLIVYKPCTFYVPPNNFRKNSITIRAIFTTN